MDRLAFEAAREASALHEAVEHTLRRNGHFSPPSPLYRRDGDTYEDDDQDSWSELDIRTTPRNNNGAPSYQSRAVVVPLSLPLSMRSGGGSRRRRGDRERDRNGGPIIEEALDVDAVEEVREPMPPSVSYEPTVSSERDEVTRELGEGHGAANCFACRYARNRHIAPIAKEGIDHIREIMRSANAGGNKIALAREMAEYFENNIRATSERWRHEDEEPCESWEAIDIYEHFFTTKHNRIDAMTSVERRLLQAEQMMEALFHEDTWVMRKMPDGRSARVVNTDKIPHWIKLNDVVTKMYNIDPGKLKMAAVEAPNITQKQPLQGRGARLMGQGSSFRW